MRGRRESIFQVADFFLSKEPMTHKKLQKLCYYAQAWHLANYGEPLLENRFEAWVHGPVSPDLYSRYKGWGWVEIPRFEGTAAVAPENVDFLESVYQTYGGYTGDELEKMSHREAPWQEARGDCSPVEYSRNPISLNSMRRYYGERIGK